MNEESNKGKRPATEDTLDQLMIDTTNNEIGNEEWKTVDRKKKKARKQLLQTEKSAGETCNMNGQKARDMREDQSEQEMETEGEGDTLPTADCNKGSQSARSSEMQQANDRNNVTMGNEQRKREIYVREEGVLKHISEIDATKVSRKLEFEENFGSNYKVTLRIMERTGAVKKDANNAIKKINEDKEKEGYRAGIKDRDTCFKGVVPLYLDTIVDFYELLTKSEDVVRIERMMRRRWNKEENKVEFEPVDSVIITFKGNQPRDKISFFNDLAVLRVRPYVAPVMQCYKCFRFGHRKIHCKSEEYCINCGEKAHGHCDKPTKCRDCGEGHKSTDRKCDVYERNQRIKKVMAYNNASYKEAMEILEGSEEGPTEIYDRYEKPDKWPLLNRQRMNQRQKPLYRDKVIGKENNRKGKGKEGGKGGADDSSSDDLSFYSPNNSESLGREKKKDDGRKRTKAPIVRTNYYARFDTREGEITREKRGIALTHEKEGNRTNFSSNEQEGYSVGKALITENEKRKEFIARLLVAVDKDWDLKSLLEQALDELKRDKRWEGDWTVGEQDKEQHRKDIIRDRNRIYREERKYRENRIVERMRQEFGKGNE
ncbi:uncharacterized protein LOC105433161 [Pogonomyrmex barbatus]|uniref:Uncharacterized protein LOC105433161 n=1 Tax=Pogonomyrmex barbatus TaxID=144034 RepID=A0A6I9WRV2_9HYME|nr:uncharacterized protein LOC105433161 [Pogonomyrmex barbatus]